MFSDRNDTIEAGAIRSTLRQPTQKRRDEITFYSRLSPIALAEKLRDMFGRGGHAMPVDNVIGHGSEQEMTLYAEPARTTGNGFTATLQPEGSGTRIMGRFMANHTIKLVTIIFLGGGAIFLIAGIAMLFSGGFPAMLPAMFIGLPLFQWVILFFARRLLLKNTANDEQKILAFLTKHCEAELVSP